MIEIAATDGDAPSNLTSPQMPHMNRAETSVERSNAIVPERRTSIVGAPGTCFANVGEVPLFHYFCGTCLEGR
ncbi:MAG: hypothetical protein ACK4UW_05180 [Rhizobium rhizophilum]|uniref:hypothetical protein n=1 Tax=Rhizobium rhizophilum TaxID=1850373 RepID=UPI003919C2BF